MNVMDLKHRLRKLQNSIKFPFFFLQNLNKEKFTCPICNYEGPFRDDIPLTTGIRKHAQCPKCMASERHRIQYLVVNDVLSGLNTSSMKMLHFAPEPFFKNLFSGRFGCYETADYNMRGVDYKVDLQKLPFKDGSYDFVFASHVLEHVADDEKALSEIRRILRPNGIAILPVPIVGEKTVEYPEANSHECYHVRAPGPDYFDRYDRFFSKVDKISSDSVPSKYQPYIYEERSQWPSKECPLRPSMQGEKHIDIVPVCYV